jgi:hypothetical protein
MHIFCSHVCVVLCCATVSRYRGDSMAACLADAAAGEKVARANKTTAYKFADKGEELDKLWEARRGCYIAAIS